MINIKEMRGNLFNRGSKHFSRRCSRDFFFLRAKATRAQKCLPVRICVCLSWRRETNRPLPCTQIITWFYNVAYLYSGQFPLGPGSGGGGGGVRCGWNNNASHFTPPSRRTFSALILSMGLTSFPR